jgi:hypothetical protein
MELDVFLGLIKDCKLFSKNIMAESISWWTNAAAFVVKGLEAPVDEWQRSLINRFASEQMKKNGGGAIVNVGSQSAFSPSQLLLLTVSPRLRSST